MGLVAPWAEILEARSETWDQLLPTPQIPLLLEMLEEPSLAPLMSSEVPLAETRVLSLVTRASKLANQQLNSKTVTLSAVSKMTLAW